jgi:hypothetical protein
MISGLFSIVCFGESGSFFGLSERMRYNCDVFS